MKHMEKYILLMMTSMTPMVATAAVGSPPDSAQVLMASGAGAALAALVSYKLTHKGSKEEAIINVLIALVGGMSFGFFGAQAVLGTQAPWLSFARTAPPFTALVLATGGTPIVEWVAGGGLLKFFRKKIGDNDD